MERRYLAIALLALCGFANAAQVTTLTADGEATEWFTLPIGECSLALSGTFDGTTAQLQRQLADDTFMDVSDASWTAEHSGPIYLGGSYIKVRIILEGGTSPSVRVEINERAGK